MWVNNPGYGGRSVEAAFHPLPFDAAAAHLLHGRSSDALADLVDRARTAEPERRQDPITALVDTLTGDDGDGERVPARHQRRLRAAPAQTRPRRGAVGGPGPGSAVPQRGRDRGAHPRGRAAPPEGTRSREQALAEWLTALVDDFADGILPVTVQVATTWGRLGARRPLPTGDGLIAATALVHDLTLAVYSAEG